MANCHSCYWADRDPDTRKQVIHEEPDLLAQGMKPGTSPPNIRIVKSCGVGAHYFTMYGRQDHDCKKWEDNSEAEAEQAKRDAKLREEWDHPTSRVGLPTSQNFFEIVEVMAEKNNDAFEILVDAMGTHFGHHISLVENLNDMNIRGEQIAIALEAAGDLDNLITLAKERSADLVAFVNENYEHSSKEEAVVEGAARFGHGPPKKFKRVGARLVSLRRVKHLSVRQRAKAKTSVPR